MLLLKHNNSRIQPFKFLDAYSREDHEIFFGREQEIEELYQKVFESKLLLVYGISGTGKTSLINCGLSNKFEESDWLPISIRRGKDINISLHEEIRKASLTPPKEGASIEKVVQSVYLDHFKPVYLIFDQFEELFIFGDREERREFIQNINILFASDLQCKCLFSIREEYLAGVTEFESYIPEFLSNRMRVEKMTRKQAREVITGPCGVNGIAVESEFPDALLQKLNPESNEIELTYLQVFLDRVYRLSGDSRKFTLAQIHEAGDVSDLLGSFLEEQIAELEDPDAGLTVLKAFVSMQGTKKMIGSEEIGDFAQTLGRNIEKEELTNLLQRFVSLRVLKEKDEHDQYELRHDSLAGKIYEKITLVEKELVEVRDFLDNAYNNYERRGIYLSDADLKYIAPYEGKIFLSKKLQQFIRNSKNEILESQIRRRRWIAAAVMVLILVLSIFTGWALRERGKALEQSNLAEEKRIEALEAGETAIQSQQEAEAARQQAEANEQLALKSEEEAGRARVLAVNARDIAIQELYENVRSSWTASAKAMNVLYAGVDNEIEVSASSISHENLLLSVENGTIERKPSLNDQGEVDTSLPDKLVIKPRRSGILKMKVDGTTNFGDTVSLGTKEFRVLNLPPPTPKIANLTGGKISLSKLAIAQGITASLPGDFIFRLRYQVTSFGFSMQDHRTGIWTSLPSNSNRFTTGQKNLFNRLRPGQRIIFEDIKAVGPDGITHQLNSMTFTILDLSEGAIEEMINYPELITSWEELFYILNKLRKENKWDKYFSIIYSEYYAARDLLNENISEQNKALWNTYLHGNRQFVEQAEEIARELAGQSRTAEQLHILAVLTYRLGDLNKADEITLESIDLAQKEGYATDNLEKLLNEIRDPQNPNGYLYQAEKLEAGNLYSEAVVNYKKSIEADPDFAEGWYNLGRFCEWFSPDELANIGDSSAAYYLKALEINPGHRDAAEAMNYMYTENKEQEKRMRLLQDFLSENPESEWAWQQVYYAHWDANDAEEALNALQTLQELNPGQLLYYYLSGKAHIHLKEYEKAISVAQEGLSLNPSQVGFHAIQVISHIFLNQYSLAEEIVHSKMNESSEEISPKQVFMEILEDLESEGISHPDFEKLKQVLSNYN